MSKPVFVVLREVRPDNFHHGFTEFEGIYKTLKAAKREWASSDLMWTEDEDGAYYGGTSRWTATLKKLGRKGVTLVIEDYEVITEC
jgi:hypothetical protein